jgi:hypothetical protein
MVFRDSPLHYYFPDNNCCMTKRERLLRTLKTLHMEMLAGTYSMKVMEREARVIKNLTNRINGTRKRTARKKRGIQTIIPGTEKERYDDQTPFRHGAT